MLPTRAAVHLTTTLFGLLACTYANAQGSDEPITALADLKDRFAAEVAPLVQLPDDAKASYEAHLLETMAEAGLTPQATELVVLVDRNPVVQLVALAAVSEGKAEILGATRTSTGRTGKFDHYLTPLGVFENTLSNPSYRAEGTKNSNGIRGYGRKGMRVWDFGWQTSLRGWGTGAPGDIRLQMHATDPDVLEKRLGQTGSKGCVRLSAKANTFFDKYSVIDAAYIEKAESGKAPWQLRIDRVDNPYRGRYMVVVESDTTERPGW